MSWIGYGMLGAIIVLRRNSYMNGWQGRLTDLAGWTAIIAAVVYGLAGLK